MLTNILSIAHPATEAKMQPTFSPFSLFTFSPFYFFTF